MWRTLAATKSLHDLVINHYCFYHPDQLISSHNNDSATPKKKKYGEANIRPMATGPADLPFFPLGGMRFRPLGMVYGVPNFAVEM